MPNDVAQPPAKQAPAHPAAATPGRMEKNIRNLLSNGGIDGPSRPRRSPRPSLWQGTGLDANFGPSCRRSFSCSTRHDDFGAALLGMSAARPPAPVIQNHQYPVPATEAGEQVKPRSAAGAADRPSREGTPAPWSDVRVKPGALPERWPRASTRPRWPVDAPITLKNCECLSPPAQVLARRGGRGLVSQAVAPRRWASLARIRRCRARSARVARTSFIERPRNRGRSGPIQMAARRRNKPPPTSPLAQPRHARSATTVTREAQPSAQAKRDQKERPPSSTDRASSGAQDAPARGRDLVSPIRTRSAGPPAC